MTRIIKFNIFLSLLLVMYSCKHEPESSLCDKNVVYFKNDVLPIIASRCGISNCHGEGGDEFPLTNYGEIMDRVEPGELEDSDLWEVINLPLDDDKKMPPEGYVQLGQDDIEIIKKWIMQGAKDNECEE